MESSEHKSQHKGSIVAEDNATSLILSKRDGLYHYKDEAHTILHRVGGPAVISNDGSEEWYQNGLLHRVDGPAWNKSNGSKEWYLYGLKHRVDGPAINFQNGLTAWYLYGERHRLDGPAFTYPNGVEEWWLFGDVVGQGTVADFNEVLLQYFKEKDIIFVPYEVLKAVYNEIHV